ncbi:hypothetical protein KIW84_042441 [Lathyrus oleraceus]|uniref:SWIM-type domain-containing protein n=1 Tax=Pisum sativum TaxID=3888 RepID=A0A9D4XFD7_PEA|nr:hypothetical protein KIW84_042441 [Pisum sativum]
MYRCPCGPISLVLLKYYCGLVMPAKTNKIRLRIHHRGKLVETPVKCFSHGLRPLNNDQYVLIFSKDVVGYDVIDVANFTKVKGELDANFKADGEETPTGVAEEVTTDPNVVVEEVTTNVNNENGQEGIYEDYVASEDSEFQFNEESEESKMGYTKGLALTVQGTNANVEFILCLKNLYGNCKKKHHGLELNKVLWATARATMVPLWEREMQRMKIMKEDAWKDMLDVPVCHWSRSHFRIYSKCDLQVNNLCEVFNREILEHREKSIIILLEGIKHYITKRMTSHKELLHGYSGSTCPKIQLVIEKNKKQAQGWSLTWHGDDDLSIFGVTNGIKTYCVDLKKETCSCRKWDLSGIPCCNVIACIWNIKKLPKDYIFACYMYE